MLYFIVHGITASTFKFSAYISDYFIRSINFDTIQSGYLMND